MKDLLILVRARFPLFSHLVNHSFFFGSWHNRTKTSVRRNEKNQMFVRRKTIDSDGVVGLSMQFMSIEVNEHQNKKQEKNKTTTMIIIIVVVITTSQRATRFNIPWQMWRETDSIHRSGVRAKNCLVSSSSCLNAPRIN